MSACSYIYQNDKVHLITDAARYEYDGTIIEIRSKVVHLRAARAAYAIRGALGTYTETIQQALEQRSSLDEILRDLGQICRVVHRIASMFAGEEIIPEQAHFELSIIGYSDNLGGLGGWTLSTHSEATDCDLPDYAPYKVQEMPACFVRPGIGSITQALGGGPLESLDDLCAVDPVTAASSILSEQRAAAYSGKGLDSVRCVGGFGELTTATKDGTASIEVIRWDDRPGAKIAA